MDAYAFVADLRHRGIRLRLEGERLIVSPAALLTSTEADWIRAHKPAVVALLTDRGSDRRIVPLRPSCVSCGAPLAEDSMLRCLGCVEAAYRERDERRRDEGRAPPATQDQLPLADRSNQETDSP
jgi:hypothetical protein